MSHRSSGNYGRLTNSENAALHEVLFAWGSADISFFVFQHLPLMPLPSSLRYFRSFAIRTLSLAQSNAPRVEDDLKYAKLLSMLANRQF